MNHLRLQNTLLRGFRLVLGWIGAMLFVSAWYLAAQAAMDLLFEVKPGPEAFRADLIAHLMIGTLLYGMSSNLVRFALATAALFTALTLGNALKMSILGGPLMPDDFVAAKNMLLLLEGWPLAGAVLMVAVPTILLWWTIAWRRPWSWINLGVVALAVALLLAFPEPASHALDKQFGNSVWNQRGNFEARGLPLQLLQEGVRSRARREPPPTPGEVQDALARLGATAPKDLVKVAGTALPSRNLHMIVLESFWDPMLLDASGLSADPIDPAFRELWAASGHAHALSPVFGGYTANTEFEILCGFPVERDNVFFEGGLRNDAPCLPRHLASAGYRSFASHPNAASFWNRVNAYRRIGFETYWSDGDFELDDMNKGFLSDASLYRQVLDRLGPQLQGPTPVFNYVLTYFGHLPYPLNAQRPNVIRAAEGHATVEAYANTMYYKSRELMDFLGELRQRDPDGLIVLFGDHLPALGNQFGGFRESGLLAPNRAEFNDAMFRTLVATPLILIDGQRGVVKTGDLPFYQLPGLLLRLLSDTRPSMMALTAPEPGSPAVRPLPGLHLISDGETATICRDSENQPSACEASTSWLAAIRILARDIFGGAQHALRRLEPTPGFRAAASLPPSDKLKPKL
ncbi:LTA synthase family protein [Thiocapsa bogorovii]|uniref:LTA synthase family protein n=1 Tax=Thiocapsa bogorovii TaxID=521689 RepID=UPI001E5175E8|nr:LTA synthase family protein [Thiocapsa bogorovii]UHD15938.1 LTA synthase family protein [Thiocapsa bogorovii]